MYYLLPDRKLFNVSLTTKLTFNVRRGCIDAIYIVIVINTFITQCCSSRNYVFVSEFNVICDWICQKESCTHTI